MYFLDNSLAIFKWFFVEQIKKSINTFSKSTISKNKTKLN